MMFHYYRWVFAAAYGAANLIGGRSAFVFSAHSGTSDEKNRQRLALQAGNE